MLHKLIQKIERICVKFDNHKHEVFNPGQAVKMIFLYTQGEKEGVGKYGHNFKSLWDRVQGGGILRVAGGAQGAHGRASEGSHAGQQHKQHCKDRAHKGQGRQWSSAERTSADTGSSKKCWPTVICSEPTNILTCLTKPTHSGELSDQLTLSSLTPTTRGWHSCSKEAKEEAKDRVDVAKGLGEETNQPQEKMQVEEEATM